MFLNIFNYPKFIQSWLLKNLFIMDFMKLILKFRFLFVRYINKIIVDTINLFLWVTDSYLNLHFIKCLQLSLFYKFNTLVDIVGIDNLLFKTSINIKNRFSLVYLLLSPLFSSRVNIQLNFQEMEKIYSLEEVFITSNWLEREVWDLFGIFFYNHQSLRRILTDYGFDGYPLRKDFPLSGYKEIFYDDVIKRIIYDNVSFSQEFRNFQYYNPWYKNY